MLSEGWREAETTPRLAATLIFVEALTRRPTEVGAADVDAALAGGVSAGALEQATLMVVLFSYMNRMVDAFGADVTPEQAAMLASRLEVIGGGAERLSRTRPWERLAGRMPTRLEETLEQVREGEGDAPVALRASLEAYVAARSGAERGQVTPPSGSVRALADTLIADAHGVQDAHIDALKHDGWSEEAIYEMVFTACYAAGIGRMERALQLLAGR